MPVVDPVKPIKIGVIGLGKIAQDQHIPTLQSSSSFELVGIASLENQLDEVPNFRDLVSLAQGVPVLSAVAVCTPPQVRCAIAREALQMGLDVLLEKPPGISVSEVQALAQVALHHKRTLFAAWHSRYAPAVAAARSFLLTHPIRRAAICWKEDVRVWHPGQQWIWRAGGLGVFDPGINALSILTHIVPGTLALTDAELQFPRNCETPIAAKLSLSDLHGACMEVDLDFRQQGLQTWDIRVETDEASLILSMGGKHLSIAGVPSDTLGTPEYQAMYAHFAHLVSARECDVDVAPLRLVADAFLCGRRIEVAPFIE